MGVLQYDRLWGFCMEHFIDARRGGWYPCLDQKLRRKDAHKPATCASAEAVKCYPSKTDYHPLAACYELIRLLQ